MATPNSSRFFANLSCEYYPCHRGQDELNCLFCYCPFYARKHCPGTPRYKEKEGRTVKVCTDCVFPHKPEHYSLICDLLRGGS